MFSSFIVVNAETNVSFIPNQTKNKYFLKFDLYVICLRKKEINTERRTDRQKERRRAIKTESREEREKGRQEERSK